MLPAAAPLCESGVSAQKQKQKTRRLPTTASAPPRWARWSTPDGPAHPRSVPCACRTRSSASCTRTRSPWWSPLSGGAPEGLLLFSVGTCRRPAQIVSYPPDPYRTRGVSTEKFEQAPDNPMELPIRQLQPDGQLQPPHGRSPKCPGGRTKPAATRTGSSWPVAVAVWPVSVLEPSGSGGNGGPSDRPM